MQRWSGCFSSCNTEASEQRSQQGERAASLHGPGSLCLAVPLGLTFQPKAMRSYMNYCCHPYFPKLHFYGCGSDGSVFPVDVDFYCCLSDFVLNSPLVPSLQFLFLFFFFFKWQGWKKVFNPCFYDLIWKDNCASYGKPAGWRSLFLILSRNAASVSICQGHCL